MAYIVCGILFLVILIYFVIENAILTNSKHNMLKKKDYIKLLSNKGYDSQKIEGIKICHISDFHDATFYNKRGQIVRSIIKNKPDIVLITGDLVDRRRVKVDYSIELVQEISKYVPNIFYTTGNHEELILPKERKRLFKKLEECGVTILNNDVKSIIINNRLINIIGTRDLIDLAVPYYNMEEYKWIKEIKRKKNKENMLLSLFKEDVFKEFKSRIIKDCINEQMEKMSSEDIERGINILMQHRPDTLETFRENKSINFTFSGHWHGGQFRIFGIRGIYSPTLGFLSPNTSGIRRDKKSNIHQYNVISRGIGNSQLRFRMFNTSELVYVTI